ncbi:MAG: SpoIIE family protein phosphatase [Leptospiraceae bacterium]|nr:SpoIIE family protein phosphatase [Leptospiraceae bacterium]
MKKKRIRLLLLAAFLASQALGAESVFLDGEWWIKEGFDRTYAGPDYNPEQMGWEKATYPLDFSKWNNADYRGWVTVRYRFPRTSLELRKRDSLEVLGEESSEELAIFTGFISDVSRIYINGHLIGGLGSADPYENGSYMNYLESFPDSLLGNSKDVVVTVALYRGSDYALALRDSRLQIGPADQVISSYYYQEVLSFALLSVYGAVGLYHLLLFSRRRKEVHNLFFGLFCVGVTLYWFLRTGSRDLVFSNHVLVRTSMEYSILFALGPLLVLFFSQFLYRRYSKIGLAYAAFATICILITVAAPYPIKNQVLNISNLVAVIMLVYILYYVIRAAVQKNKDAYYLLAGFFLFLLGAVHDILATFQVLNTPHVTRYAFLVFILGIAGILANRFVRVHNQVEELNQSLEKKVEKRTEQLQNSLQEIQTLKVQQDGDYYLTSLLIKPLGGNFVESRSIDIDILMRQKKQFQFRRWEAEIGGDLIASHTIQLQSKTYAAFVNGDAMGKSIQGAGGALVLGVVFKAIISRTQQSSDMQQLSPERWLRICFEELQNVFVSFDGTMMISAILGLVDEDTGMLYFVNAEHPWAVLYRNQKATFLEHELQLRKIGIEALRGKLTVQTFAMQPGDVAFIGSDGRDDIQIGVDKAGHRIINEDENEFLRRVEDGDGQLERIEESILSHGLLTDDFTLIRIAYREDAPIQQDPDPELQGRWHTLKAKLPEPGALNRENQKEISDLLTHISGLRRYPTQKEILRELAQTVAKLKDHQLAVTAYEALNQRFPEETEGLFWLSYHLKRLGDYERAVDVGEQVRLRQRDTFRYLIHLADSHRLNGNLVRARKILNEAAELNPEDEKVKLLQGRIPQSLEIGADLAG